VSRVVLYTGANDETAVEMALRDDDQYKVKGILAHRGEPVSPRKYMTFLTRFSDEKEVWVQYGPNISSTEAFQIYISSHPELKILLESKYSSALYIENLRK
jgi:hypothetical protein